VPLIYVGRPAQMAEHGALSDLAPSMLYLMNIEIPPEMTGTPLIDLLTADGDSSQPDTAVELHG
jgi:2,3-bisphosphoglycerate-independent phosphoglycerate mutase